jgi:hypothetical protein
MANPNPADFARFIQERYGHLLKPENVFDLANHEHRQLLINLIKREWADSLTIGLCVGDASKAKVVTIMRADFADTITLLTNFRPESEVPR